MPSPSGVCGLWRLKGAKLDADDAGRLLVRDDIPDGVSGVRRTSKSNGEEEYCDEAIAETLSKPAK
jgi:hypothetical protein